MFHQHLKGSRRFLPLRVTVRTKFSDECATNDNRITGFVQCTNYDRKGGSGTGIPLLNDTGKNIGQIRYLPLILY